MRSRSLRCQTKILILGRELGEFELPTVWYRVASTAPYRRPPLVMESGVRKRMLGTWSDRDRSSPEGGHLMTAAIVNSATVVTADCTVA
jgi:hypothetical protein